jgi:hypothetical protein
VKSRKMDEKQKIEVAKMEKVIAGIREQLMEINEKAGITLLEKDEVVDKMVPLVATVQKLDYRLKMMGERMDMLVRELVKAQHVVGTLEQGKEAQEAYIG